MRTYGTFDAWVRQYKLAAYPLGGYRNYQAFIIKTLIYHIHIVLAQLLQPWYWFTDAAINADYVGEDGSRTILAKILLLNLAFATGSVIY